MVTEQWIENGLLIEKAGLLRFHFEVIATRGGMSFRQRKCTFVRIGIPKRLAPTIQADVAGNEDGWEVEVQIRLGPKRLLCRYAGRMQAKCK